MTTVYERLKALQITLPDVQPPVAHGYVAAFVPFVQTGNLVYLAGRLAKKDGKLWPGKVGEQITTLEGKEAARGIAIELLATLQAALGDLDKIKRIVKLEVLVNSTPNFTESHVVANGASELFLEIFGERGAHARTSFGGAEIPFGVCGGRPHCRGHRRGRRPERRMIEAIRFINSVVPRVGIAAGSCVGLRPIDW